VVTVIDFLFTFFQVFLTVWFQTVLTTSCVSHDTDGCVKWLKLHPSLCTVLWKEVLSHTVYSSLCMFTSYLPDVTYITNVLEKHFWNKKYLMLSSCLCQPGCACVQSYFLNVAGVNRMRSGLCRVHYQWVRLEQRRTVIFTYWQDGTISKWPHAGDLIERNLLLI
jgi:hypothetical protein